MSGLGSVILSAKDYTLADKKVLSVSKWFKTETLDVTIGEAQGMPKPGLVPQALGWFVADGWVIKGKTHTKTTNRWLKDFTVHEWSRAVTYRLERKTMQSESVLQDMISEFTSAYNEGRKINNDRYKEIVAAYISMVSSTQNALSEEWDIEPDGMDLEKLVRWIIESLKTGIEEFKESVESAVDKLGVARREEVVRKFSDELANARRSLIDKGLYNNTIWQSISSRIQADKQLALNDLEEKIAKEQISSSELLLRVRADISGKILDAYKSFYDIVSNKKLPLISARNTVYKWMLDFMERREDQYPDMANLYNIAQSLGYATGGTVSPGA